MFRKYDESCGSSAVHKEHWRLNRDLDRVYCRGIFKYEKTIPWAPTKLPISELDGPFGLPEYSHKHFYKVTPFDKVPRWVPKTKHNLYFICECGVVWSNGRSDIRAWLLGKKDWDQTWPQ